MKTVTAKASPRAKLRSRRNPMSKYSELLRTFANRSLEKVVAEVNEYLGTFVNDMNCMRHAALVYPIAYINGKWIITMIETTWMK